MSWHLQRLNQLGHLSRGRSRHRPRDAAHLYDGPYPFIQTGDVKHAGLYITDNKQTYSEAGLDQSKLWPAGTLCITIAANIADTAILAFDACFPDSVIGFIADESNADTRFVKYLFDATIQQQVQQFTQGAAQDNLSQEKLLSIEFLIPGIDIQRRIADILSAYDDLIENNRRRIVLLEEEARQLYREWFVRLRFPGHEHTRIINGVPEGWESIAIGSAFQTVLGGTPSRVRTEFWDGGTVPWINSGKVNELRVIEPNELITEAALNSSAAKLMPRGTTVLAITGATLGQVSMLEIECAANQSVVGIIDPTGLRSEFAYLTINHRIGELVARATGGAQVHINKDIVNAFGVILPSTRLSALFKEHLEPMFRQIALLMFQNRALRAARDLLLPKLMSGEIAI